MGALPIDGPRGGDEPVVAWRPSSLNRMSLVPALLPGGLQRRGRRGRFDIQFFD
jgi:hypothetical protein